MIRTRARGFTIVELIVVIIVIAILTAIATVLYMGAQTQARDTQVHSAAAKFSDAIALMSSRQNGGKLIPGGWGSTQAATSTGCASGSGGYQTYQYGTINSNSKCTLGDAVVAAGYLSAGFFTGLPASSTVDKTNLEDFIVYTCSDNNTYLFYTQEDPAPQPLQDMNTLLSGVCSGWAGDVNGRGMGGAIKVDVLPPS